MSSIIAQAEIWNVVIGLESNGDTISAAKDNALLIREFNHPLVRLNDDTGNALIYSARGVDVAKDIKYGLEYLDHVHLKTSASEVIRWSTGPLEKAMWISPLL